MAVETSFTRIHHCNAVWLSPYPPTSATAVALPARSTHDALRAQLPRPPARAPVPCRRLLGQWRDRAREGEEEGERERGEGGRERERERAG